MAFLTSSIPYFKAALQARLAADATIIALKAGVFWGNPHPAAWPEKSIHIRQAQNRKLQHTCGITQANEDYDLQIECNFTGSNQNTYQSYEEGAYGLAAAVEASIVAWAPAPLCSGTWGQVSAAIAQGGSDEEGIDEKDRDATVHLTVHVTARLI